MLEKHTKGMIKIIQSTKMCFLMQVYLNSGKPTKQRGLTAFPLPVNKFTFLLFLFFFVLVSYVHHHKCARKTGNIRKKQIITSSGHIQKRLKLILKSLNQL